MKTNYKSFKLIITLILLVLAVFGIINSSYSYFASKATKDGSLTMGELKVNFTYLTTGEMTQTVEEGAQLTLYPVVEKIERGVPFKLSILINEQYIDLANLSIKNNDDSCACYVRFWLDAFVIVNGETQSTNYGKYFALTRPVTGVGVNNFTRDETSSYCYYIENELSAGESLSLEDELTLQDIEKEDGSVDAVPIDILGQSIQITISFEAVQKGTTFEGSIFDDEYGYYEEWT